jgi:hypothetical protein
MVLGATTVNENSILLLNWPSDWLLDGSVSLLLIGGIS